jgi:Domain of unknown function (DUF4276)
MKEVAIYVEGGGDTAQQRAELRNGLDRLLNTQKQAARDKRLRWKLVPCGGRQSTYDAFINAVRQANRDTLCVLLVDSEGPIAHEAKGKLLANAQVRKHHLETRDGWDLNEIEPESIHLMVQCVEAWIVADPGSLANYYGKGFRAGRLPSRLNLEDEPKPDVYSKFAKATKDARKGPYSEANNAKIKHASALLTLIDPKKVAARCPRFVTFITWLDVQIGKA